MILGCSWLWPGVVLVSVLLLAFTWLCVSLARIGVHQQPKPDNVRRIR